MVFDNRYRETLPYLQEFLRTLRTHERVAGQRTFRVEARRAELRDAEVEALR